MTILAVKRIHFRLCDDDRHRLQEVGSSISTKIVFVPWYKEEEQTKSGCERARAGARAGARV
jgi:hypothetical protein